MNVTSHRGKLRQAALIFALNTTISLVYPLLVWSVGLDTDATSVLQDWGQSFLFSQIIGTLGQLRFCRFWMTVHKLQTFWEWGATMAFFIAVAAVGCLTAEVIDAGVGLVPHAKFWTRFLADLKVCVVLTVLFGIGRRIYMALRSQLEQTELDLRDAELAETTARLAALESKIHPHFLFNALNSISSLIPHDAQQAEQLLGRMAALLRFSLDAHPDGLVPLGKETRIVTDYLEIEQARLGQRLRYEVQVPADLHGTPVPCFAIQTLVENSIKYAIAPVRAGGQVTVRAEAAEDRVEILVTDTGPGFAGEYFPPGHGLSNLQVRLRHLFGEKAKLTPTSNQGIATMQVTIPRTTANARISG